MIQVNYYRDKDCRQLFHSEIITDMLADWVLSIHNKIRLATRFPFVQETTIWITRNRISF